MIGKRPSLDTPKFQATFIAKSRVLSKSKPVVAAVDRINSECMDIIASAVIQQDTKIHKATPNCSYARHM